MCYYIQDGAPKIAELPFFGGLSMVYDRYTLI